jgi:PiT family inorganic phosphate transporter
MALLFDFLNGMNNAASSVATIISTRVLSPVVAVVWAALFHFMAIFIVGLGVAKTMGEGIVVPQMVNSELIFSALLVAIIWTHICTQIGLPISVSHALIGGLVGAALVQGGMKVIVFSGVLKICLFIFLSPLLGAVLGYFIMLIIFWIFRLWPPWKVDNIFRRLQLVSAAVFSISHGSNDAQKTMGIIALLLFVNGYLNHFYIPFWVVTSCYLAISLGTLLGGWKVIKTMGVGITRLQPVGGFCAETSGGITVLLMSILGIPVSTTHTITGAVIGVGSVKRITAVRWHLTGRIVLAWVLTVPLSAFVGAIVYYFVMLIKNMIFM